MLDFSFNIQRAMNSKSLSLLYLMKSEAVVFE